MGEELVLREEHFLDLLFEVLFNGQLEFLPTRVPCLCKRIGHHLRKSSERVARAIQNIDFKSSAFAIASPTNLY